MFVNLGLQPKQCERQNIRKCFYTQHIKNYCPSGPDLYGQYIANDEKSYLCTLFLPWKQFVVQICKKAIMLKLM